MKKYFLFACVAAALVSCSSDEFLGETGLNQRPADGRIAFSSTGNPFTRAQYTGADAAERLGNYFTVEGYKGGETAAADPEVVFDNYRVQWDENTANTTESNTNDWEYVGVDPIDPAKKNGITSQTIKYWDYSKAQYDFIAWSTGTKTAIYDGDPTDGQVLVSAINPGEDAKTEAYTFKGTAADLSQTYIADLVTVKKANSEYGQPVKLVFRQLGTKVRIGIYETVPGYSVKNVEFYSAADSDDAAEDAAKLFTTTENSIYTKGTYTVYFPTVDADGDADNNKAHVDFDGTGDQSATIAWGGMNYTIAEQSEKTQGEVFLGRTSNTASFAGEADDDYYVTYLPNEDGTNLNLRVNYTLESIDGSGEVIYVKGATAQVPSIYAAWKPGYAYTYLFKITDKSNGHTGVYDPTNPDDTSVNSDPAGLYPITFDAVVENAEEDNWQETITTVSAPSITTYQKGSKVVNNNEYIGTTGAIYVTVNEGKDYPEAYLATGDLVTLTDKAALYTVAGGSATEASVVDALSIQEDHPDDGVTVQGRNGLKLTTASLTLTDKVEYGVDGNTINVETDQAAKFTGTAGKTYAFVYTKTEAADITTTDKYAAKTFAAGAAVKNYYRYDYKDATAGDAQKGVKYFKEVSTDVYAMQTMFVGQGVSNLYLDDQGTTIASGLAKTGTQYYYTTNAGVSYKEAHNVAYAAFETAELYTFNGTTYNAKTDDTPADGVAYYYKETDGSYTYCVILPEQTTGLKELDTATYVACGNAETAIAGQVYFDKYVQNNGVRYVKIIKVQ